MTPRPLRRWKTFWFGLLILAFLGWAWVRSVRQIEYIDYEFDFGSSQPRITLGQGEGTATFGWDVHAGGRGLGYERRHGRGHGYWFAAPLAFEGRPSGNRSVAIAHWLLILLFLVPWGGFLLWRVHRLKRLTPP